MTDQDLTAPEAVERPLDEVYDTQREVEQNPCGAWQAIQALSAERGALEAENARLREASRPPTVEDVLLNSNLKFKTRAKIARARQIIDKLPEDQAKPLADLCAAHAAMAETNARLWRDNQDLRAELKGAVEVVESIYEIAVEIGETDDKSVRGWIEVQSRAFLASIEGENT